MYYYIFMHLYWKIYFDFYKFPFIIFVFVFLSLLLFNIWFPHEAFAMEPNTDDVIRSFDPDTYTRHELDGKPISNVDKPISNVDKSKCWWGKKRFAIDYYGQKEYQGRDAYGYYHPPQNLNKATQVEPLNYNKNVYDNPYDIRNPDYSKLYTSNNPDHQVSDNRTNYNCQELGGKAVYKCKPEQELHLSKAKNIDSLLVSGKQPTIYELEADYYEDTISTSLDSTNFNARLDFVRNFNVSEVSKVGMLSNISLGVKAVNNNIVFIYIKLKEIGKRKILWTIWERDRGKYESYQHFKRVWESNRGVISKIKKDMRNDIRFEIEDLLGVRKIKKDLKKTIRSEVEKLLRERQPYRL